MAIILPLMGLYRWHMEATAFTVGLDYFEPEFQTYWISWFYGQRTLFAFVGAVAIPWLWFTRPTRDIGIGNARAR